MSAWSLFLILCSVSQLGTRQQAKPADALPYPIVIRAEVPMYPPAAWSAHLTGNVEIEVTVRDGAVVDARVTTRNSGKPGSQGQADSQSKPGKVPSLPFRSFACEHKDLAV